MIFLECLAGVKQVCMLFPLVFSSLIKELAGKVTNREKNTVFSSCPSPTEGSFLNCLLAIFVFSGYRINWAMQNKLLVPSEGCQSEQDKTHLGKVGTKRKKVEIIKMYTYLWFQDCLLIYHGEMVKIMRRMWRLEVWNIQSIVSY